MCSRPGPLQPRRFAARLAVTRAVADCYTLAVAEDFIELVARTPRRAFVESCDFPFLYAVATFRTIPKAKGDGAGRFAAGTTRSAPRTSLTDHAGSPRVLPVRKVQQTFASMITVGRTKNNDVVLADTLISKLHAYFQIQGRKLALVDAGSANGTRVDGVLLPPKGEPRPVGPGDRIGFGQFEFVLVDAGGLWDAIRSQPR
jgi:hypothetical protein